MPSTRCIVASTKRQRRLCLRTDKFSAPDLWMPHISLALHDTTPVLMSEVLRYLNAQTFNLKFEIDNLVILEQQGANCFCGRKNLGSASAPVSEGREVSRAVTRNFIPRNAAF